MDASAFEAWVRSPRRARAGRQGSLAGGLVAGAGVAGAAQQAADTTITTQRVGTAFVARRRRRSRRATPSRGTSTARRASTTSMATNDVPAGPGLDRPSPTGPSRAAARSRYTFTQPGTYTFLCQVHPNMTGTITVTGEPTEPTPDADRPPRRRPTPTRAASRRHAGPVREPADHAARRTTPAPGGGARGRRRARDLRAAARGDPPRRARDVPPLGDRDGDAALQAARRRGKVVRTARLQVRAGTRTVTVRGDRLRARPLQVELQARDGAGNRAPVQRASLRIKRARG